MQSAELIQSELNSIYEEFKNQTVFPAAIAENSSPPLLLSVPEKWVKSTDRVLIIGQETQGWDFDPGDYFPDLKSSIKNFSDFQKIHNSVPAMTAGYRSFEFARHQPANYNSPFWRAYRSVRSQFDEQEDGYETSVLWTNLFRIDLNGTSVVRNGRAEDISRIREAGTKLLLDEIDLLNPTATIFFTGPNYNEHLYAHFPDIRICDFLDHDPQKTAILEHPLLPPHSFRTYHPGYLSRSGQLGTIQDIINIIKQ